MSDNNEIKIPSFMNNNVNLRERNQRRSSPQEYTEIIDVDFQKTKKQSCDSKMIHAKKSKKKVSQMSSIKKMGVAFGLGVGVTLGVIGYANKENIKDIPEKFQEWQMTQNYLSDLYDVIHNNEHINSKSTWYDTGNISTEFRQMLDNGVPEDAIAFVTANSFSYAYEMDERDSVFDSLFNTTPDEWAKQHGYDSIEDNNLIKDVRRNIIRSIKADEYNKSLTSMIEDNVNEIDSVAKGVGGK